MVSLSSSKQMPVDHLKLGQDHCLQNCLQFAKHFAFWHHIVDSVRNSTWLDVPSQANTHSTAECEFESAQKLTSNSMERSFLANWRYRRFTLCSQEPAALLKKKYFEPVSISTPYYKDTFLGVFAVFEKQLLVSSCLSVCTSAWNNSAPFGRNFMNLMCNIVLKYGMKIQVCLKSNNYIGPITWTPKNFWYLTFRGPCIVIYSYNKTNEMH